MTTRLDMLLEAARQAGYERQLTKEILRQPDHEFLLDIDFVAARKYAEIWSDGFAWPRLVPEAIQPLWPELFVETRLALFIAAVTAAESYRELVEESLMGEGGHP